MSTSFQLPRSSPVTCAQVRCTSPTGARGPAGTPCRASSALTAVEGLRDGGEGVFSSSLISFFRLSASSFLFFIVSDVQKAPESFLTHRPSSFTAVSLLLLTAFFFFLCFYYFFLRSSVPDSPQHFRVGRVCVCVRVLLTCSLNPPLRLPATFSPPAVRSLGAAERDRKTTSASSP